MDRNLAGLTGNTGYKQIEGFAFLVLFHGNRDFGVGVSPGLLADPRDLQDEAGRIGQG